MTLEDIKCKAFEYKFITEMKNKLKDKTNADSGVYTLCVDVLMYSERAVVHLAVAYTGVALIETLNIW